MRAFLTLAVIGLSLLLVPTASYADTSFDAFMYGYSEVPPNASPATGFLSGTLSGGPGTWAFNYTGNYTGLLAPETAGHLHLAPAGINGAVIHPLLGLTGGTSGAFGGLWNPSNTQAADLLAGNIYVNIHTAVFPGGEIRGQLAIVPEPASLGLLGIASAVTLLRRRRN